MFSSSEVCEILLIKFHQLTWVHSSKNPNRVPNPAMVGGHRVYTRQEVLSLSYHFGIHQEHAVERMKELVKKQER